LLLFSVFSCAIAYDLSQPHFLEVNFFDVGQGDSIFIQTPSRYQIIIDGGPNSIVLEKLAQEIPFWDRTIDLMILTHPEKDHISGLLDVLKRYKIENVLWTGIIRDSSELREWQRLLGEEGANIIIARSGQRIIFPDKGKEETKIDIFYPVENSEGKEMEDSNETSVVGKLIFGDKSFLFTGDISKSAEKKLLEKETNLKSDVLKIAHHGSKYSSGDDFIGKVLPEIAVIQAGKDNSYGHPSEETLAVLEKYGISILRTDINKDIKIICDSQFLKLD
ncbi:MAG: MBL fold metallo-hydrolase, partial [Candidatus Nealsonbacteria bacterium]|nr:MBL fold metallo-hydrolase [Candidatus Nealsonbacteria bacterium]